MKTLPLAGILLSLGLLLAGCESMPPGHAAMAGHNHAAMWASINRAVAVLTPTKGSQVSGTLYFDKTPAGIHVHGTVAGLEPRSVHAMHIHEFGDASSDDGMAAGSHYNPENHPHGDITAASHHAGDLGNITADESGKANINLTLPDVSLADVKDPIIGRGVVVHAKPDDFSQPVGNAGGRLAVGVIGISKPQ